MAEFYGVKAVMKKGQRVCSMTSRQPTILEGEVLVGIASDRTHTIAVDLTRESDYKKFLGDYEGGAYRKIDLYTLPRKEVPNCPDEGRIPLNETENP
jgi:hypothetical protein